MHTAESISYLYISRAYEWGKNSKTLPVKPRGLAAETPALRALGPGIDPRHRQSLNFSLIVTNFSRTRFLPYYYHGGFSFNQIQFCCIPFKCDWRHLVRK